jgi:hypothetical protein
MIALPPDAAARVARRLSGDALHAADANYGYVAVPDAAGLGAELAAAAVRRPVSGRRCPGGGLRVHRDGLSSRCEALPTATS